MDTPVKVIKELPLPPANPIEDGIVVPESADKAQSQEENR